MLEFFVTENSPIMNLTKKKKKYSKEKGDDVDNVSMAKVFGVTLLGLILIALSVIGIVISYKKLYHHPHSALLNAKHPSCKHITYLVDYDLQTFELFQPSQSTKNYEFDDSEWPTLIGGDNEEYSDYMYLMDYIYEFNYWLDYLSEKEICPNINRQWYKATANEYIEKINSTYKLDKHGSKLPLIR